MSKSFGPPNPYLHNADSGSFSELSQAYKANPTIANYVELRRKYPKALIEVATSKSMDWLLSNGKTLEAFGIPPNLVAGCLDATPSNIQELSLLLIENMIERDRLESEGCVHIQTRDDIISDSLINYLIATASTKQYQAATPLGGFPCGSPKIGSNSTHLQVPAAVPINSSQVVIKKAPR